MFYVMKSEVVTAAQSLVVYMHTLEALAQKKKTKHTMIKDRIRYIWTGLLEHTWTTLVQSNPCLGDI